MNHYVDFLNLAYDPFAPTKRARDFYAGAGRESLLSTLLEQALTTNHVPVVSGALGSGKSTLAQELCRRCSGDTECALVQATLFMNEAQFLAALTAQFSWLDADDPEQLVDQFRQRASTVEMKAGCVLLLVDDAHELASDVVRLLGRLVSGGGNGLSVLLLGEEQLPQLLRQSLPARVNERLAEFELPPFGSEDSFDYVRFKLLKAGYKGSLPLSGAELGALHNSAAGVPGRLNVLLASALANTDGGARHDNQEPPSLSIASLLASGRRYWVAAAVLVVMLMAVLLSGGDEGLATDKSPSGRVSIPVAQPGDDDDSPGPGRLAIQSAPPAPVDRPEQTESVQRTGTAAGPAPTPVSKSPAAEPDSPPVEPVQNARADAAGVEPAGFGTQLLRAEPDRFTVQIMGSRSVDNAQRFIRSRFAEGEAGIIETRFEEQPWFVVVYGDYASRDAATAAIAGLSEAVQELRPWVRSLADLQAAAIRGQAALR